MYFSWARTVHSYIAYFLYGASLSNSLMHKNKNKNFIDPIHSNIDSKFGASIFGKTK